MSESGPFRGIAPAGGLKVPLAPGPAPVLKPPGTPVRRAEPLIDTPPASAATLAPMGGITGSTSPVTLTSGHEATAIVLEPVSEGYVAPAPARTDGLARFRDAMRHVAPGQLAAITDQLRLAGVWADRWTSPDLIGQLHLALKRPVDTILCNALDFDDALPLQQRITASFPLEVVAAVALLAAASGAKRAVIVVGVEVDDAGIRALQVATRDARGVEIEAVRNDFPQPNPTLLLHTITGRPLRAGSLPTEAGVILLDAAAAAAAGKALLYGEPLLHACVGVADLRTPLANEDDARTTNQPHFLSAPVGLSVSELLRNADVKPGAFELRGGSPLRDVKLPADCVISAGGEVALYLVAAQGQPNPDPCIRCGWCVSGCPVHINPAGILQAAQADDPVAADRCGIESCIECGVCTYVCPSYLPLLAGIRTMRRTPAER